MLRWKVAIVCLKTYCTSRARLFISGQPVKFTCWLPLKQQHKVFKPNYMILERTRRSSLQTQNNFRWIICTTPKAAYYWWESAPESCWLRSLTVTVQEIQAAMPPCHLQHLLAQLSPGSLALLCASSLQRSQTNSTKNKRWKIWMEKRERAFLAQSLKQKLLPLLNSSRCLL